MPRERSNGAPGLGLVTALMPSHQMESDMTISRRVSKLTPETSKRAAPKARKAAPPTKTPVGSPPVQFLATGKISTLVALMRRPQGASVLDLMKAAGWQAHSVRGAISGAIKKRLGLSVVSERVGGVRVYHIVNRSAA